MSGVERELAQCEYDPFYFVRKYIVTFDEADVEMPWKSFPDYTEIPDGTPDWLKERWTMWSYLQAYTDKIITPGDKYWLKSQRMLVTILFCAMFVYWLLFENGFNGFVTSKPGAVDAGSKGGWNSLFGKMRSMFDRLPGWLIESQMGKTYHSSDVFNYMAGRNELRGNVIIGQSPTENAGVGEGFSIAVVDEVASIYDMHQIHTNLTQSCISNKNYISFPRGQGNKFADIHFHPGHFGFEKVVVSWRENPRYTQGWYDKLPDRMSKFEISQRIDMSFEESTQGKVWKAFSEGQNVKPTPYLKELPVYLIWDFGFKDATSIGLCQRQGDKFRIFDWLEMSLSNYRKISMALRRKLKQYDIYFERDGSDSEGFPKWKKKFGSNVLIGYGDAQVKSADQLGGKTIQDSYAEQGFRIEACDHHDTIVVLDKIDDAFEKGLIEIDPGAEAIRDACQYWGWPEDRQGNPKQGATQPAHTAYSHAGKALEYGWTMIFMHESAKEAMQKYVSTMKPVKDTYFGELSVRSNEF